MSNNIVEELAPRAVLKDHENFSIVFQNLMEKS